MISVASNIDVSYFGADTQKSDRVLWRYFGTVFQGEVECVFGKPLKLQYGEELLLGCARPASGCFGLIDGPFEDRANLMQDIVSNCVIFDELRLKKPQRYPVSVRSTLFEYAWLTVKAQANESQLVQRNDTCPELVRVR